jgi:molybdopterin/thiamine biosynthesis adenylyltransferase/rhodanese-related sulfurtransferase
MFAMSDTTEFNEDEWLRYGRHIQLPKVGAQGQARLKRSRVLIIGAGGLGSPVALYLAAAGVGHIDLADDDTVELSNLQRQILFDESHLKQSKAESGASRLQAINSSITVEAHQHKISKHQGRALIEKADIVIDCCDNLETRYAVNAHCIATQTPWVYASIHQFAGQLAVFKPGHACFQCLFPTAPEQGADCNTAGVMGVLPGLLGCMQASEALKLLLELGEASENTLVLFDALNLNMQKIRFAKQSSCPACSDQRSETDVASKICFASNAARDIDAREFDRLELTQYELIDVRSEAEHLGFNLGGRLVPLDTLEDTISSFDDQKHYLCYCQVGMRSAVAVELLQKKGYRATNLSGGIQALLESRRQ